ncbi:MULTISPECIES: MurR/RpiR family transcriptional regulator [Lactococcus]|uniref:MurR/RpiR family transcriptional regulator n=1 Tax=Lactococcus TaxID=1357 RepID=UPI0013FD1E4E|nr:MULTISPECIES: MurR/RpiR family transcriptional regulator [Lactococcus]MDC0825967.1 MurR/RpiR family transcriptional regulator [Lactococcus petauri]NHI75081.1 MurR/RpiR family transcriptional regulator [Lactococcus petauri]QSR13486.1 MurR/RpiR family transcriptional regulator [Lactococcus sp. LG606]USI64549.1 MurR/RpiR family transcriptional regulator [Lactococcus petauri]
MKFEERALNFDYKLTELEDDLVDYILKNKEAAARSKITVLAKEFYSVPNTITRFCHKLGYEGFTDLKASLKWELDQEKGNQQLTDRYDLMKNIDLIDLERQDKCIRLFHEAKAINFFAIGQTGDLSKVCIDNFYAFDPKFIFSPHPNTVAQRISHAEEEIFFFISLSGESEAVLKLAQQAKVMNHCVISLTNLSDNNLARIADLSLFCYAKPEIVDGYNVTDKTPLMIIMNSLFRNYIKKRVV